MGLVHDLVGGQDLNHNRSQDVVGLVGLEHVAIGVHLGIEGIALDVVKDVGSLQDARTAGRHPGGLAAPVPDAILAQADGHDGRVNVQVGPEVVSRLDIVWALVLDGNLDRGRHTSQRGKRHDLNLFHDQVGQGWDVGRFGRIGRLFFRKGQDGRRGGLGVGHGTAGLGHAEARTGDQGDGQEDGQTTQSQECSFHDSSSMNAD